MPTQKRSIRGQAIWTIGMSSLSTTHFAHCAFSLPELARLLLHVCLVMATTCIALRLRSDVVARTLFNSFRILRFKVVVGSPCQRKRLRCCNKRILSFRADISIPSCDGLETFVVWLPSWTRTSGRVVMDTRTSVLERLALTGMAASVAESVTFPVDMTKTRMQLHGERTTSWSMATRIAKDEGVVGFYRGLSPALLRHCVYTSLRIVIYEQMREALAAEGEESLPLYKRAFAGASAGVLGQAVASPTDLVKVRMQADGRRVVQGLKPRYAGMSDAVRTIMKEEGFKGLYKGLGPNLYRAGLVNLGELTTYDTAKHFLLDKGWNDNLTTHTTSAIVSGFFATAFSCPADVVKSRIMAADAQGKYSGTIDCLVKTVRHEGVSALYKGFFPSWARLGPFQFTFWIVYEQLRQVLGMKGF